MIRVARQMEPSDFETAVGSLGRLYLTNHPPPTPPVPSGYWNNHDYWTNCKDELMEAYDATCAYSGIRQRFGLQIDHYKDKSFHPYVAYDWANYRLCIGEINSTKRRRPDILDPFTVKDDWFDLDVWTGALSPAKHLDPGLAAQVKNTIVRLKLNSPSHNQIRRLWLEAFRAGHMDATAIRMVHAVVSAHLHRAWSV